MPQNSRNFASHCRPLQIITAGRCRVPEPMSISLTPVGKILKIGYDAERNLRKSASLSVARFVLEVGRDSVRLENFTK
jgi:hypothetical protein